MMYRYSPIRGTDEAALGVDSASRRSSTKNATKMFIPRQIKVGKGKTSATTKKKMRRKKANSTHR